MKTNPSESYTSLSAAMKTHSQTVLVFNPCAFINNWTIRQKADNGGTKSKTTAVEGRVESFTELQLLLLRAREALQTVVFP